MIPAIGYMVGLYIITRMVVTAREHGDNGWIGFLTVVTILVAVVGMMSLCHGALTAT